MYIYTKIEKAWHLALSAIIVAYILLTPYLGGIYSRKIAFPDQ